LNRCDVAYKIRGKKKSKRGSWKSLKKIGKKAKENVEFRRSSGDAKQEQSSHEQFKKNGTEAKGRKRKSVEEKKTGGTLEGRLGKKQHGTERPNRGIEEKREEWGRLMFEALFDNINEGRNLACLIV